MLIKSIFLLTTLFSSPLYAASIFQNFGEIENLFPINFENDIFDQVRTRTYFSGERLCSDQIYLEGIEGPEASGVLTVMSSTCPELSGEYEYLVYDDGFWLTQKSTDIVWIRTRKLIE